MVLKRRGMRRVCSDDELELRGEAASGGDPTSGGDPAGQVARPWRSRDLQSRERRGHGHILIKQSTEMADMVTCIG